MNGKLYLSITYLIESVFLSCKVKKYNKYNIKQDRIIAVTEKHIYNIKGKSKKFIIQQVHDRDEKKNPNSGSLWVDPKQRPLIE